MFPFPSPVNELLVMNFVEVLAAFCETVVVFGIPFPVSSSLNASERVKFAGLTTRLHHVGAIKPRWWSILLWGMKNLWIQIQFANCVLAYVSEIDAVIFLGVSWYYLLAIVCAILLRTKVAVTIWDRPSFRMKKALGLSKRLKLMLAFEERIENLIFELADQLAVESEATVKFLKLDRYETKLAIYSCPYVDTQKMRIRRSIDEREELVGYVGRLVPKKGVMNFLQSIRLLVNKHPTLRFVIAGEGALSEQIGDELSRADFRDRVEMVGWISHEELPLWLNRLKILILPSVSEGVPGIVKEAMACGALVLATPVGGVPDLIQDGDTGFIIKDNSPEAIAESVTRALLHPNLERITKSAQQVIAREFSFEAMVESARQGIARLAVHQDREGTE